MYSYFWVLISNYLFLAAAKSLIDNLHHFHGKMQSFIYYHEVETIITW